MITQFGVGEEFFGVEDVAHSLSIIGQGANRGLEYVAVIAPLIVKIVRGKRLDD